jgi:hypothetical protein
MRSVCVVQKTDDLPTATEPGLFCPEAIQSIRLLEQDGA